MAISRKSAGCYGIGRITQSVTNKNEILSDARTAGEFENRSDCGLLVWSCLFYSIAGSANAYIPFMLVMGMFLFAGGNPSAVSFGIAGRNLHVWIASGMKIPMNRFQLNSWQSVKTGYSSNLCSVA